jgi:peptidoglycan/LPS O-acetylase OafA/YrhL
MGIYAYYASRQYKDSPLAKRIVPLIAVIIIGGLMFFGAGKYFYGSGRWDIVIWGLGFMTLCIWQSVFPSLLIANRFLEYLGERSFSIYLLHPIIITFSKAQLQKTSGALQPYIGYNAFFVCAALTMLLVLLSAELTYRLVETPGIRFGRELITRGRHA